MTNLFAENKHRDEIKESPIDTDKIVLIDINNVAQWTQMHEKDEFSEDQFIDGLPWEQCWFEWTTPKYQRINGKVQKTDNNAKVGVACMENETTIFYSVYSDLLIDYGHFHLGTCFKEKDKDRKLQVVANPQLAHILKSEGFDNQYILDMSASRVTNVRFAITFCHCKNVEYYEKSHPEKLQKANIKRGKIPQETYRILDIGGLTKQAKSESTKERGELQTALHICRGHFKTYTEENPLFGTHTGTYWWPMHKRGSEKNGKVIKDYKVVP